MSDRTTELRDAIGSVVDRWYRAGLIRFRSDDDGSDDLLLRDELTRAALASQPEPTVTEALRGADRIAAERQRQIEREGWSKEHDQEHPWGALALAGACYAMLGGIRDKRLLNGPTLRELLWPWEERWWKPAKNASFAERLRELEKAGALIAAEIDRLLDDAEEMEVEDRVAVPAPSPAPAAEPSDEVFDLIGDVKVGPDPVYWAGYRDGKARAASPSPAVDRLRCGKCGDDLLPSEVEGHLNSEGRTSSPAVAPLDEPLERVLADLRNEVERARAKHAPMHSPHEGHSVIREELDPELWTHVCADTGRSPEARHEALQVAAMGVRYILDLIDDPPAAYAEASEKEGEDA